jgi:hypothetical protein
VAFATFVLEVAAHGIDTFGEGFGGEYGDKRRHCYDQFERSRLKVWRGGVGSCGSQIEVLRKLGRAILSAPRRYHLHVIHQQPSLGLSQTFLYAIDNFMMPDP